MGKEPIKWITGCSGIAMLLLCSCRSVMDMNYRLNRYISQDYPVLLNGDTIHFNYLALDEAYINHVLINKRQKAIYIDSDRPVNLRSLREIAGASSPIDSPIVKLAIFQAYPIHNKDFSGSFIQSSLYDSLIPIKQSAQSHLFCGGAQGDILIIK